MTRDRQIMRRWINIAVAAFAAVVLAAGCGNIRKVLRDTPAPGVRQPARKDMPAELQREAVDTVKAQPVITFRRQDGTEMTFTPTTVDSLTGEKIMTVGIEQIVVSASSRRNIVERNGMIDLQFMVTVPQAYQNKKWQVGLTPQLRKGTDSLTLDPLIISGDRYRRMQEREYKRYNAYTRRIVDSLYYFDRFGDKTALGKRLSYVAQRRTMYAATESRLESMTPEEAVTDAHVGWMTPRERRRLERHIRKYVLNTDQRVQRLTNYTPNPSREYDHLNDYFAPRYRFDDSETLPGGEIYTRVNGTYNDGTDLNREAYFASVAARPRTMKHLVRKAPLDELSQMAIQRFGYTSNRPALVSAALRELADSATQTNYRIRKQFAHDQVAVLSSVDTVAMRREVLNARQIARNERLIARQPAVFARRVPHPYQANARLDTVVYRPDGKIDYLYTEQIPADENTSRIFLHVNGDLATVGNRTFSIGNSDTLTYSVASMTNFVDEQPRYIQRIVLRDAEASARFFFTFPVGRSTLVDTVRHNREQVLAVRELTRKLMTDPIYMIDSITLRASTSPEGQQDVNERLARERGEALQRVLITEFQSLYDSLKVSASVTIDDQGRQVFTSQHKDELPDLPNLLRVKWAAANWDDLVELIRNDSLMPEKEAVLATIAGARRTGELNGIIRRKHSRGHDYIVSKLYPQMRAVDFRFNLHRRGMQQDTVYTTEIDSNYMHAVQLLKKRRYADALEILRPFEDRNTALAYMSLGYDAAAYRILRNDPQADQTADLQYMLAILASRLNDEQQAVLNFLRAVELRENLKFRGNLDPEISRLIRKYGLFRDDF